MSIRPKLTITFLLLALIPTLIVGLITFKNYRKTLQESKLHHLQDILDIKIIKIENYISNLKTNMEIARATYAVQKAFMLLNDSVYDQNRPEILNAKETVFDRIENLQKVFELQDILFINPKGEIIYSSSLNFYKDYLIDNLLDKNIYQLARDGIYLSDIYFDTADEKKSEMLLAASVNDFYHNFLGIIVFEINMNVVYKHIEDATGLGKTGELVLGKRIDDDVLYLNSLKYDPNSALKKKIKIGGKDGIPIQNAVLHKTGYGIDYDYRGQEVLAAWKYIPSLSWGIVAKIDTDEALAEIANLQKYLFIIIASVFGTGAFISVSFAHSITKPIHRLLKGVQSVGAGNLDINLSSSLNDEIGDLSRAFEKMTRNLKITTASRDELNKEIFERKRVEETLRRSELRYRELVQNANSAIIRWNHNGAVTFFNEYAQNFFGYKLDEILGKSVTILLPKLESTGVDLSSLVNDIVENPQKFAANVNENICKDRRRVWMAWTNKPVFDENGKVVEIFAVGTDITDRKKAEIELKQAHDELEQRVKERTIDLDQTIDALQKEIELRTKAEKTIDAERQRLNDVLEMLPAYAILLTPDYNVAYSNKFFQQRFGKHSNKKCYEFLFNRTGPCENCKTFDVLKTNQPQFWEWVGPDGKNYDIYDYPFKDSDGSPLIMEIGVDVTSHKQLQKTLNSSSLYARGLIEASVDPLVTISLNGKITDVNKATEDVTGFPRQILVGSDFSDYFTEPQKAKQGYEKALSEGQLRDYPLRVRHKSGKITDVIYNASVYQNEAGQVQGVFAAARDITKTKAAEEKQNFTNALLELFARKADRKAYLDSSVQVIDKWSGCECAGIRISDNKGNIPYESYIGFDKKFLDLENSLHISSHDCICVRTIMQNPIQTEKKYRTDGNSFFCNDISAFVKDLQPNQKNSYRGSCIKWGFQSLAVIPIRYRSEVLGAIHIADFKKDMVPADKVQFIETTIAPLIGEAIHRFNAEAELDTYRKNLEEMVAKRTQELERSNKDLEQFAYVASHDLQEPLRAVAGFIEILKIKLGRTLDSDNLKYMNFTIDGVMRMQALIQGLLKYSRAAIQTAQSQSVDAGKALNSALAYLERSIAESEAQISIGDLPTVSIDESQLIQLFQNLIGNALKFKSDKKPHISINAEKKDGYWRFAVSDNGIGIEQEYAERIFLIFQRLHSRDKYPGTGIGLSICKKIVERNGGRIWVESQPGHGSTFYFTLPEIGVN
ncbi:MAG: hypothetical protein A2Y12_13875 [Planctomycetes bacterium GWF2_42_9]|nr:MAG: hypothetical protein A2Y12_13875 [Planctomycetes bacterium GWF2_42_9]